MREFDVWFVPATWDVEQTGDRQVINLVDKIILRLAGYSNGDCPEPELKQLLGPLAETPLARRASV